MADRMPSFYAISRVEAYTDAVFAIAATLLVLDLSAQALGAVKSDAEMWAALGGLRDNLLAFVVSFLLLSLLWMVHFDQFRSLAKADATLLWLNNVRLLFIVLIPFTTSLVAEYSEFVAGRVMLPVNFFFAALVGYLSWAWAASRNGHLLKPEARERAGAENAGGVAAVVCGAVAAAVSPWLGSWGFCVFFLNGPLTALLQRIARRRS